MQASLVLTPQQLGDILGWEVTFGVLECCVVLEVPHLDGRSILDTNATHPPVTVNATHPMDKVVLGEDHAQPLLKPKMVEPLVKVYLEGALVEAEPQRQEVHKGEVLVKVGVLQLLIHDSPEFLVCFEVHSVNNHEPFFREIPHSHKVVLLEHYNELSSETTTVQVPQEHSLPRPEHVEAIHPVVQVLPVNILRVPQDDGCLGVELPCSPRGTEEA